uniref:TLDc domain-containing protein n=1 Tax=Parastrongyloides trichosuri TaxID=131310 RepID=A0A0N4Z7W6_PARTI
MKDNYKEGKEEKGKKPSNKFCKIVATTKKKFTTVLDGTIEACLRNRKLKKEPKTGSKALLIGSSNSNMKINEGYANLSSSIPEIDVSLTNTIKTTSEFDKSDSPACKMEGSNKVHKGKFVRPLKNIFDVAVQTIIRMLGISPNMIVVNNKNNLGYARNQQNDNDALKASAAACYFAKCSSFGTNGVRIDSDHGYCFENVEISREPVGEVFNEIDIFSYRNSAFDVTECTKDYKKVMKNDIYSPRGNNAFFLDNSNNRDCISYVEDNSSLIAYRASSAENFFTSDGFLSDGNFSFKGNASGNDNDLLIPTLNSNGDEFFFPIYALSFSQKGNNGLIGNSNNTTFVTQPSRVLKENWDFENRSTNNYSIVTNGTTTHKEKDPLASESDIFISDDEISSGVNSLSSYYDEEEISLPEV